MKRGMEWKEPYNQSMDLCKHIDAVGYTCKKEPILRMWKRTFCCVAKYLGFNRATRRILWEELVRGNWKRLHQTTEEESKTAEEWLEMFCGDVAYCSDRWSLDRLTRCHWLFRQYMEASKEVAP